MTVGGRVGALWIGGLEPYMDEGFLQVINNRKYQNSLLITFTKYESRLMTLKLDETQYVGC